MDSSMSSAFGMEPTGISHARALFGQLQLTAWRGPDHRNVTAIRTLVGCMEFLDGIDFVTEEFDTEPDAAMLEETRR